MENFVGYSFCRLTVMTSNSLSSLLLMLSSSSSSSLSLLLSSSLSSLLVLLLSSWQNTGLIVRGFDTGPIEVA